MTATDLGPAEASAPSTWGLSHCIHAPVVLPVWTCPSHDERLRYSHCDHWTRYLEDCTGRRDAWQRGHSMVAPGWAARASRRPPGLRM